MPQQNGTGPMCMGRIGRGSGLCGEPGTRVGGGYQRRARDGQGRYCLRENSGFTDGGMFDKEDLVARKKRLEEELAAITARLDKN